jgi:hypothetical protein
MFAQFKGAEIKDFPEFLVLYSILPGRRNNELNLIPVIHKKGGHTPGRGTGICMEPPFNNQNKLITGARCTLAETFTV